MAVLRILIYFYHEFDEMKEMNFRELPLLKDSGNESVGKFSHTQGRI